MSPKTASCSGRQTEISKGGLSDGKAFGRQGRIGYRSLFGHRSRSGSGIGLTRTAALEYAPHNIRINAVGPGFIRTSQLDRLSEDMFKALTSRHPVGRLGEPSEVAELTLWLNSDKASFVIGSYYAINGGYLSH